MSHCEHKTMTEYQICNRCQTFVKIAQNARLMLQKRKEYMDILLLDPTVSEGRQMVLQDAVKNLERSVDFATQSGLWD